MNIRTIALLVLAVACNNVGGMGAGGDASGGGGTGGGGTGDGGGAGGGASGGGGGGDGGSAGTGSGSGGSGATGTDSAFSEEWTSGSRITARTTTTTVTSADGASMTTTTFGGWFDSQLNLACSPQLAADGVTRCLPSASASLFAPATTFADSACTVPVALEVSSGCSAPTPTYIFEYPATTCPVTAGPTVYQIGASYSMYYVKSGSACDGPTTIASYTFYSLGAEVPTSTFAEMTVTTH